MLSTTPLTDIFLLKLDTMGCGKEDQVCDQLKNITHIKSEDDSTAKSMSSIRVNVLYDKVSKKLIFAHGGDDFVDVLFSFLTFPLGCIVKLLERNSSVRCLDNLYKSVEVMDVASGIMLDEFKNLLLAPKLDTHFGCTNQILGTEEKNPSLQAEVFSCDMYRIVTFEGHYCKYNCTEFEVLTQVNPKLSSSGTECGGGYAKKSVRFMITDDMVVTPHSPVYEIDAIKLSKTPIHNLVEKEVVLQKEEVANLLKACLISRAALTNVFCSKKKKKILLLLKRLMLSTTPLTDTFLLEEDKLECGNDDQECDQLKSTKQTKLEDDSTAEPTSSIRVNVLYDKLNRKVLSAQGGGDFVDVIFSFLTFPLGCIVKLLERYFSMGCLDNLYKSVELLDGSVGMKSEECKNLLSSPKLYTHFGCNNLLRTEEKPSQGSRAHDCKSCWNDGIVATPNSTCKHNINVSSLTQVNPKLSNSGTECGGGYAKKSVRFMITDDMVVTPLSPVSGIDAIKHSRTPFHCLVEKEVVLGEAEVANLMKACLISCTALTKVFCSKKMKKHLY